MSSADQPTHEHQVGITSAQESNPDRTIADLTAEMNTRFAAGDYAAAGRIALEITARSKDELAATFREHGVLVLHLDHEAFGIYEGQIEPSYDVLVDGRTDDVLTAAREFGKRHAQEMILIARKLKEGEADPLARLGLTITLGRLLAIGEAVRVAEQTRKCGFLGATFAPNRAGTMVVYHTESLGMSEEQFENAAKLLHRALEQGYPDLHSQMDKFFIYMPRL